MKNILLTGSTGFIGSELLKYLSNYNKVYITVRKKYKINLNNKNIPATTIVAEWIRADTGVGPFMARGSQIVKGYCAHFVKIPINIKNRAKLSE